MPFDATKLLSHLQQSVRCYSDKTMPPSRLRDETRRPCASKTERVTFIILNTGLLFLTLSKVSLRAA